MPRTVLTKTTAPGEFGTIAANAADLAMTAADAVNLNQFVASGRDLVIVHNTGAVARTVSITSVVDEKGRTGDVSAYSLAAGEYATFGVFTTAKGWRQTDGAIYLEASHADVKFGVISF